MSHNFGHGTCLHFDCGGPGDGDVCGYQCNDCGHYFPRRRVFLADDSEYYCREGMGHNTRDAIRQTCSRA
jgi:hypothetical protein